jgi:hypothetical protein
MAEINGTALRTTATREIAKNVAQMLQPMYETREP